MSDAIIKVFVAYEDTLRRECRAAGKRFHVDGQSCYELFGIDVLFRSDASPVILEINYSPQIDAPMPMDKMIKGTLLADLLHLAGHRLPPPGAAACEPGASPADSAAEEDEEAKVKAKDHPDYVPFFKLLKKGVLPRGAILRNARLAGLDPAVLDTPEAMVPAGQVLALKGSCVGIAHAGASSAACVARAGAKPTARPAASVRATTISPEDAAAGAPVDSAEMDATIDAHWLKLLPGLKTRKSQHFKRIFPRSAEQIRKYAPMFPTGSARRRYAAFADRMAATESKA